MEVRVDPRLAAGRDRGTRPRLVRVVRRGQVLQRVRRDRRLGPEVDRGHTLGIVHGDPVTGPRPDGRQRADRVERGHVRAALPAGHRGTGAGPDHRQRVGPPRVEREHVPVVLQQNGALLLDLTRDGTVRPRVDRRRRVRAVEQAEAEHDGEDPADMVVDRRHAHLSIEDSRLERVAVERRGRQLHVHAVVGALDRAVARVEVRQDEPVEAERPLEDVVEQRCVLARVHVVDEVLGAHDRTGVPILYRRLERRQVDLVQRPLVDQLVDRVAVDLLVVGRVVLDVRDDALGLDARDVAGRDPPGEVRVLAERLEGAPVQRYPRDVDVGPLHQVAAGVPGVATLDGAVPACRVRVERGRLPDRRGQRGRGGLHRPTGADPGRAVVHQQRRYAQPVDRQHLAGVRRVRDGVHHLHLLVQRQLRQERGGPLVRASVPIHPGRARTGTRGYVGQRRRRSGWCERHRRQQHHRRSSRRP